MTEKEILQLEWFDGLFYPPEDVRSLYFGKSYPAESAMLIGTEGAMLLPHGSGPILLPEEKFKGHPRPKLPPRNHYHHFADACLGGEKCESHFAQTGPMTEAIILGTVAIRTPGEKLEWNSNPMKIPNNPTAQGLLRRKYREDWGLDDPSGKDDKEFIKTAKIIEQNVLELKKNIHKLLGEK